MEHLLMNSFILRHFFLHTHTFHIFWAALDIIIHIKDLLLKFSIVYRFVRQSLPL